jgi:hypothetical protein
MPKIEQPEEKKDQPKVYEVEINLQLLNQKLNYLIEQMDKLVPKI